MSASKNDPSSVDRGQPGEELMKVWRAIFFDCPEELREELVRRVRERWEVERGL